MSSQFKPGLGLISTIAITLLTGMAVVISLTLVLLTTKLHGASDSLQDSVASIKVSEEAEVDLLVHARTSDPVVRGHIESRLRRKLEEIELHVTTARERTALDTANRALDDYLRATTDAPADSTLQAAHQAIRGVVNINVAQAEQARRNVDRWDDLGDMIGTLAGVTMVVVLGGLFWWIRRAVIRPTLELAAVMARFRTGDTTARATESGALELREMSKQFNAMRDSIERQHEQRLTYLAGVAHDLRNPLSTLQLCTDQIDPQAPLPPEDRVRKTLTVVHRQVTRLTRMVTDLLEAAQIEAGRLAINPEVIDMRDLVGEVADLFEGTSSKHVLEVDVPAQPLVVRGDPVRISQTLINLVSNAIKYSPRGGHVRVAAAAEGSDIVVRVSDNGLGMSHDDLERLWEPFRRGGHAEHAIPGVGLGLSVAKRIVDAHGGQLAATSELGVGTTFTLRLPALVQARVVALGVVARA